MLPPKTTPRSLAVGGQCFHSSPFPRVLYAENAVGGAGGLVGISMLPPLLRHCAGTDLRGGVRFLASLDDVPQFADGALRDAPGMLESSQPAQKLARGDARVLGEPLRDLCLTALADGGTPLSACGVCTVRTLRFLCLRTMHCRARRWRWWLIRRACARWAV
jgi:hypothetical protein